MSCSSCSVSMTMDLADHLSSLVSFRNLRNSKAAMNLTLFVCLVLLCVCIMSAAGDSCCQNHHLETCDVFGFNSSLCTFYTKDDDGHGGCPRHFRKLKGVPNGMDVRHFNYQLTSCTLKEDDPMGDCLAKTGLKMITLNVTFTLHGPDFKGILFHLENNAFSAMQQHSCHYIIIERNINESHVKADQQRKLLYFDGFDEEIHPGSSYKITYRTLPAPQTSEFDVVSSKDLHIPDCRHLQDSEAVYFCSLASPAKWNSSIVTTVFQDENGNFSVNVTFTTVNDSLLNSYVIGLSSSPDPIELLQERVRNDESEWHWDDELESLTIVRTYTNVPPGINVFQAFPNHPGPCNDPHWGIDKCPIFKRSFEVSMQGQMPVESSSPSALSSALVSFSSLSLSPLLSSLTIPDDTVVPIPDNRRSLTIFLISLAFFFLIGCCIVIFFYRYSWSKYVCSYGDISADMETVKSGHLSKDVPRPLITGPNVAKYRVIHPEDDLTTTPEYDRITLTMVTSPPEYDVESLIIPGRNEYFLHQKDQAFSTPDDGYPETPPVIGHEAAEDMLPPRMETLRQDSGFSDVSHSGREDPGRVSNYFDSSTKPNCGFQSHSQLHRTNHSEFGHGRTLHIQRETVI